MTLTALMTCCASVVERFDKLTAIKSALSTRGFPIICTEQSGGGGWVFLVIYRISNTKEGAGSRKSERAGLTEEN